MSRLHLLMCLVIFLYNFFETNLALSLPPPPPVQQHRRPYSGVSAEAVPQRAPRAGGPLFPVRLLPGLHQAAQQGRRHGEHQGHSRRGGMGAGGFLALHFAHTLIHAALYVPVIDVVVLGGSSLIASVALGENLISIWQK